MIEILRSEFIYIYIYIYIYIHTHTHIQMHMYWYKKYAVAQLIKALRMAGSIPADVVGIFH